MMSAPVYPQESQLEQGVSPSCTAWEALSPPSSLHSLASILADTKTQAVHSVQSYSSNCHNFMKNQPTDKQIQLGEFCSRCKIFPVAHWDQNLISNHLTMS